MSLKKTVTMPGILFASISAMIGSGWLFGPLLAAQFAGNAAIISWVLGGILVSFIALTFAEVVASIPLSGGIATYLTMTHGNLTGFLLGWVFWLSVVFAIPIEAQAVIQYATNYFPSLAVKTAQGTELSSRGLMIAVFIMAILSIINSISVKFMTEANKFVSFWKVSIPILIGICFVVYALQSPTASRMSGEFAPYGIEGILKAISLGGVIYAFNGFQYGLSLAGELKKPSRSIPFAALGSIAFCIIIYGLLQFGFLMALPSEYLANGWAALSFEGDAGPVAGLATLIGLFWVVQVIYVDAMIATMGAGIIQCATAARSLYALSLQNYLPPFFAKLNRGKVPYISIIVNFFVGLLLFVPFSTIQDMISFLSAMIILAYMVGPISLIAFRSQLPDLKRPFILPAYKFMSWLAFSICSFMLYWSGWSMISKIVIVFFSGFIVFSSWYFVQHRALKGAHIKEGTWLALYLLGISAISYFGQFEGGSKLIPFGVDFFLLSLISLTSLIASYLFKLPKQETQKLVDHALKRQNG